MKSKIIEFMNPRVCHSNVPIRKWHYAYKIQFQMFKEEQKQLGHCC